MKLLYIKNMVCNRCILVVKNELVKLGFHPEKVVLGEVELQKKINNEDKTKIAQMLNEYGFELIDNKKGRMIEKIKNLIIEIVHHKNNQLTHNLSDLISRELHHDYNYLSALFSEVEGITIEQYFIAQKIERVKELLVYDELSLSEIAFAMHYSSVAHLSAQFKKVTGLTPSHFKKIKSEKRQSIDQI